MWLRVPEMVLDTEAWKAVDSYVLRKGLAYFFVSNCGVISHKKYDKPAAIEGHKASKLWAAGGLNATEMNAWRSEVKWNPVSIVGRLAK